MKKTICRDAKKKNFFVNYVTPSVIILMMLGLISCSNNEVDNTNLAKQRHLIAELEKNQLIWSQSGVSDYSFSLNKECTDCPADAQVDQVITVKSGAVASSGSGVSARSISARDGSDDDDDRSSQSIRNVRVESLFSDLRQAILQNSVQQVSFDPIYGFPQSVQVNNGRNIRTADFDDDDDRRPNRNIVPNISFQSSGFQVFNRNNNAAQNITLNGQLIRQGNQFWLVDTNGQWKQLNVQGNVFQQINQIPDNSYVTVTGQWLPGGVSGQGQVNVQQIVSNQANPLQNNLAGTLLYSVLNNSSFDLKDFYVTNDSGRNVFLNLPNNLQNQAFQLAGQRVNLDGSWNPSFGAPNARFIPTGLNSFNNTLQSFTGILAQGNAYQIPGLQQSNYVLIDDFGGVVELQVPVNLANNLAFSIGQRVTVQGSRVNSGAFGQSIVAVQSVNQQQNLFTTTMISGVVTAVLPADVYGSVERVLLQLNTGNSVTLQIPSMYHDPFNTLAVGMQVQANGAWITNSAFGQGEFEARSPVQITSLGLTTNQTYSGYISNVGSISNGANCNAQQTNYTFVSDNGQQFQLIIGNNTLVNGMPFQGNTGVNLSLQSRIQVSGIQVSPGVLQAQNITVTPQFQSNISGTIIEIGASGSTFTCAGALNSYRLMDSFGNAYLITTTGNTLIQGVQGAFLRIGDVVQVTGSMASNGSSFNASSVVATAAPYTYTPLPGATPFPTVPTPNNAITTFTGTVTGLDCARDTTDVYNFVDHQSGQLYAVSIGQNVSPGLFIDVGTQLQVTGTLFNNVITAQQVASLQTFADPINRIPVSGTIISVAGSLPTTCNTPVYTYQFQNDNGQFQQIRVTNEAAQHLAQPLGVGSRITIVSRVQSSNVNLIDALEIQYQGIGTQTGFPNQSGFPINGQQPFAFNNGGGQIISVAGTVVSAACGNQVYFVDQNGTGYQLQLNANSGFNVATGVGVKLNVTGQIVGNQLIASSVYNDTSAFYTPVPIPVSGTIQSLINTETLTCGVTVSTYNFQNDNGITQRLRVASNNVSNAFTTQTLVPGSRVTITNQVQSFDGSVIDAITISQNNFF